MPDGSQLAFFGASAGTTGLWTVPLKAGPEGLSAGVPDAFLRFPFVARHPAFSPDGHWLAYSSSESGTFQIYVMAFPEKGGKWQISNSGGLYPQWSRSGRDLFFRENNNLLMVVNYTAKGDSFVADKPRLWSQAQLADPGFNGIPYDVAADGRVAGLMPLEAQEGPSSPSRLIFLENFVDELRRRVPLK